MITTLCANVNFTKVELHIKPKLSTTGVLFQNYQHTLENICKHPKANCLKTKEYSFSKSLLGQAALKLQNKRWDFFVLPIFNGVIMDGHPIFWVVDASVDSIHHD